jgi:Tfp pilus assembly protein PilZ
VAIVVEVSQDSEHNLYADLFGDIADGGLFVATYDLLDIGSPVDLTILLYGRETIEVRGRVSWIREENGFGVNGSGFGVHFDSLTARARALLDAFSRVREPMLYDAG